MIPTVLSAEGGYFGGFKGCPGNSGNETHARLKAQARRRKEEGGHLPHCFTTSSFLTLRLNRTGQRRACLGGRRDAAVVLGRRRASTQTTSMHQIAAVDEQDDQDDDHHQRSTSGVDPRVTCTRCGAIIPATSTTVDGGRECRRCGRVERVERETGGASA